MVIERFLKMAELINIINIALAIFFVGQGVIYIKQWTCPLRTHLFSTRFVYSYVYICSHVAENLKDKARLNKTQNTLHNMNICNYVGSLAYRTGR
jgi:hypothetical protein